MTLLADPRQADDVVLQAILRMRARQLGATPRRASADASGIEADWSAWLRTLFPRYLTNSLGVLLPFAGFHTEFWEWLWAIEKGSPAAAFVGIWGPRRRQKHER